MHPFQQIFELEEGITDGLVRISVGIEDTNILVDDLKQALDTL
ncbi:PLP-dependent transferase [Staphylococcus aureus]